MRISPIPPAEIGDLDLLKTLRDEARSFLDHFGPSLQAHMKVFDEVPIEPEIRRAYLAGDEAARKTVKRAITAHLESLPLPSARVAAAQWMSAIEAEQVARDSRGPICTFLLAEYIDFPFTWDHSTAPTDREALHQFVQARLSDWYQSRVETAASTPFGELGFYVGAIASLYREVMARIAELTKGGIPEVGTHPNDERDRYCYEERKKKTSNRRILNSVNSNPKWDHLATEQGVVDASDAYAKRHGKESIRNRQRKSGGPADKS